MQIVKDFVIKYNLERTPLAFGVSGGADSLAAVLIFHDLFPKLPIVALTVDHGLRPTSNQEALFVADVMKKYGETGWRYKVRKFKRILKKSIKKVLKR